MNIFKTLRLRYRWADVDDTWHVYSLWGQNFWKAEFWILAHAPRGRDNPPPERGAYLTSTFTPEVAKKILRSEDFG